MGMGGAEGMGNTTTYRRPSVSIGMGLDGADYSYLTKTTEAGGFFIAFNVPFRRQDVFNELLSDDAMLGHDDANVDVKTTILKAGRDPAKPVRTRALRPAVWSASRIPTNTLPPLPTLLLLLCQVSSGCVRETTYGSPVWGRTINELREIKAPTYIRASTLMQEGTLFQFHGQPDDNPKVQIALKELKKNTGTSVTIRFDFLEVSINGPFCCFSFMAQDLLKTQMEANLPNLWTNSMLKRGYDRADKKVKKGKGVGGGHGI